MKLAFAIVLAGLVIAVATSSAQPERPSADGLAAQCVCPPQDLKSRTDSKHVFIGTAVERNDDPKDEGFATRANAEFRFDDIEWLKGEFEGPVLVRTYAVTCSTTFEIGQRYAVFANKNDYGELPASFCSGNRIATPEIIGQLRKLLRKKGQASGGSADKGPDAKGTSGVNGASSPDQSRKSGAALSKPRLAAIIGAAILAALVLALVIRRKKR